MFHYAAGVTSLFCPDLTIGQGVTLRFYRSAILGLLILLWSTVGLAVPAGTVISNTASISYTIHGIPGPSLKSNNNQFTVSAVPNDTSSTMDVAALNSNIYAGSTHATTITITNTGTTTLINQQLSITLPLNSQVILTGGVASLISTTSSATTTTALFNVANLLAAGRQEFQLTLTLPASRASDNQPLLIQHRVNDTTAHSKSLPLSLLPRTQATLEVLQYSHAASATPAVVATTLYKQGNGTFATITPPALPDVPGVRVTDAPITLKPANTFSHGQPLFIRVTDPDQNLDNATQETLDIELELPSKNERLTLRLHETGVATGIFSGYTTFQKGADSTNAGALGVQANTKVIVNYTDKIDSGDSSTDTILVDPYGAVFDSATGESLDGYTVQLVDADSGLAATVYGDDGVSRYPSTMVSGASVTDSSGNIYHHGSGEYRFPLTPAGNYRLIVTPPSGAKYRWPSTKPTELLYKLPRDNIAITLGSRGETFALLEGPPLHIDLPVDPLAAQLHIQRNADRDSAAAGDFVRYSVTLENVASVALDDVVLTEVLPRGFRLKKSSLVIDGNPTADPLSTSGATIDINLGALAPGEIRKIDYISAIGAANPGIATSRSYAVANTGAALSNHPSHDITIVDELMRGRALLLGQIIIDPTDGQPAPKGGLKGVRLYMEDGRYAISDERGMFHFDNITPGSHVVQLDLDTLPDHYQVVAGDQNSRVAGGLWSQFVDLQGGTLWRTDFHVARKEAATGNLSIQISNSAPQRENTIPYQVELRADTVDISNLRLTLMIPASTQYLSGSSRFGGNTISDPEIVGNVLTYRLDSSTAGADWSRQLHLTLQNNGDNQTLTTKASLLFDTPAKPNQRLPLASHTVTTSGINSAAVHGELQTSVIKGAMPGDRPTVAPATSAANSQPLLTYNSQWLKQQGPEIDWVVPQPNDLPAIPTTDIAIKHSSDHRVTLTQDGALVAAVNFNGMIRNDLGAAMSSWSGIDLKEGNNHFTATLRDTQGNLIQQLNRNIHYSSAPVRAELLTSRSTLTADSITQPVLAIRLYDKDNYPIHAGMEIEYSLNPPHQPARNSEFIMDNMAAAPGNRHYATTDREGIIWITLAATNSTDDLILTLPLANSKTVEIKTRLQAKGRDWILVGLAEGDAGFNTLSGNVEALKAEGADENLYQDGRVALFAKGQVLGRWLLTMAYDSDKQPPQKNGGDPQLFQSIDPGKYYTLYGDAGQNGFDAASSKKLYLKLERDAFYLLFGDYQTNLNNTKLARYERTLTGIKSRYEDEQYNLMLFISENSQAFIKDELRGQSSTGPYRLSRSNVALNSEKAVVEVRDRFRSEVIISSRELTRYRDYDINYLDGTLTLREPLFSTDSDLNPQYLIMKYEAFDSSDNRTTSGGRAEINHQESLKVGLTQINEGRRGGDAMLSGADLQYQISDATTLRLEAARSRDSKESATNSGGNAYLAELEHQSAGSNSKLYLRETDTTFGLGQTNASENGVQKLGVETSTRASDNINIKGQLYRQENSATQATRTLGEAQGELSLDGTLLRAGLRRVNDQRGDGSQQQSEQLTTGVSHNLFDNRVTLRADREINLNSNNDSVDFPDKTRLGVDYHLTQKISLFAEQEIANSELRDTRQRRLGIKSSPWNGAEIYSGLTQSNGDSGDNTSANIAARQKWQLNPQWSIDLGGEESRTVSQDSAPSAATPFNPNSGFAIGSSEEFSAASLGLTYTEKSWLWSARIETRNGSLSDRRNLTTSLQSSPLNNLSMLTTLNLTESKRTTGEQQSSATLQLGVAYRPSNSRWLLLDKLQLKTERKNGATVDSSSHIINLLNANYKTGRWQTALQYGAKSVNTSRDGQSSRQFIDISGVETRYDLTPKWDIGLHANILHAWQLRHYDYNSGISVGHTVAKNLWVSLGYNFTGFRDADFSSSNHTSKGLLLRFRVKFDQSSLRDAVKWASQ